MLKKLIIILSSIILYSFISIAQEVPLPVETQFSLMTKILSFDKKLSERINSKIVFGILYQSKFRSSITVKEELEVQFNKNLGLKVDDLTVEFVSIDVNEPYMLEQSIEEKKINVLYLTPL